MLEFEKVLSISIYKWLYIRILYYFKKKYILVRLKLKGFSNILGILKLIKIEVYE